MLEELVWEILPSELKGYFDITGYEKTERIFRIMLSEKNVVPELPKTYRGKKIINTVTKSITIDDFPIRGRKVKLTLKRRMWKFKEIY